jgi:hypothetical protein
MMAKETKTKKEKPKPKSKYSNAGKGDKSRVSDANKYAENWEKIFGKKKGDDNVSPLSPRVYFSSPLTKGT